MRIVFISIIVIIILSCSFSLAQSSKIKVWQYGIPGAIDAPNFHEESLSVDKGQPRIIHVTSPELYTFFPAKDNGNRTAVILLPGGGYSRLAIYGSCFEAAQWLNELGITAFVLKYRLPNDTIMVDKAVGPLQDAQEAIRLVRKRANEWNLDPRKIGVMGFSAGGHLAASLATLYDLKTYPAPDTSSARPDFTLMMYGGISMLEGIGHAGSRKRLLGENPDQAKLNLFSGEMQVTANTPPAFIVHSANDSTVPYGSSVAYFNALRKFNIPAELHVYETGGHGYGLNGKGGTESGWPLACAHWLKTHGFLTKP